MDEWQLTDLVDISQHGAVEVAVFAHGEHVTERTLGHFQDSSLDSGELGVDEDLIGTFTHQTNQNLTGFLLATLENEPTGGFGQEHDETQDDRSKEDLESERESPGDLIGIGKHQTEINPVTDRDTASDHRTLDHDQLATAVGLAAFGLPGGDGGRVDTIAKTSDQTTDDQLGELVRGTLQDSTDAHDEGTEEDGLATTQHVTDPDGRNRTGETSQIVRGNRDTLTSRLSAGVIRRGVDGREVFVEGFQGQQTT